MLTKIEIHPMTDPLQFRVEVYLDGKLMVSTIHNSITTLNTQVAEELGRYDIETMGPPWEQ